MHQVAAQSNLGDGAIRRLFLGPHASRFIAYCSVVKILIAQISPRFGEQVRTEARVPLTAEQKREVDDAFSVFDYAKTGVLDLHEVRVR